jgi:hypothetical protein
MRSIWVLALIAGLSMLLHGCSGKPGADKKTADSGKGVEAGTTDLKHGGNVPPLPVGADGTGKGATKPDAPQPATSDLPGGVSGLPAADMAYVLPDFFAAVVIHPQRISKAPMLASLPQDKLLSGVQERMNLDPRKIEQGLFLLTPNWLAGQAFNEGPAGVIRSSEPIDAKKLLGSEYWRDVQEVTIAGKLCYTKPQARGRVEAIHMPNSKTIVFAMKETMAKMLTAGAGKGPLAERLARTDTSGDLTVVVVLDPARQTIHEIVAKAKGDPTAPPAIVPLLEATDDLSAATIAVDLTGGTLIRIAMDGKDAAAAGRVEDLVNQGVEMARQVFTQNRGQLSKVLSPMLAAPLIGLADSFLKGISVSKDGQRVVVAAKKPEGLDDTMKLLAPTFLAGVESARGAADRTRQSNNLKQIGLALHSYDSIHGTLPPAAICDKDGKPLLSWRVAILPLIEQQALYEQFHLDEPWDSENNKKLIERMPDVYLKPGTPNEGKTGILALVGDDTAMGSLGAKKGTSFAEVRDGLSNTILVVAAGPDKAVTWTQPADAAFDKKNPASALGQIGAGFLALFCDGSVRTLSSTTDAETLGRLFNRHDGEPIEDSKLLPPRGPGGPTIGPQERDAAPRPKTGTPPPKLSAE